MPTVLREQGFAFMIHTNDHLPANVHVRKAEGECKIVIQDEITIADRRRMKPPDASKALRIARENVGMLRRKWEEIHGRI